MASDRILDDEAGSQARRHAFPLCLPPGAIDTQLHMYLPGFPVTPGGPGLPISPLPTAARYRQVMRWLGINRVVITQGNAHQHNSANLLACLAEKGDCARGVAVITTQTRKPSSRRFPPQAWWEPHYGSARRRRGAFANRAIDARTASLGWMLAFQFNGTDLLRHVIVAGITKSNWVVDHYGKFLDGYTPRHIDAVKRLIDGGNVWIKFAGCYEASHSGRPDYDDVASVAREIGGRGWWFLPRPPFRTGPCLPH